MESTAQHISNRSFRLVKRPTGLPTSDCFDLVHSKLPELGAGEVLLKTEWLSLDPYMRGRMNEATSYAPYVGLGDVMVGESVSKVMKSRDPALKPGDLVTATSGWQEYSVRSGAVVTKLGPHIKQASHALGVLGMPGLTAYSGLLEIASPKAGETVVVAAATGAVGSIVGQLAKLQGCRVIGIAGGEEKCRWAVEGLGFDVCIDHRGPDLAKRLAESCPNGIDIYFETVGGPVLRAVVPLLNLNARVPVCGQMSQYNPGKASPESDFTPALMGALLSKRVTMRGFIVYDFAAQQREIEAQLAQLLEMGKLVYREHVVNGFENVPDAFIALLKGQQIGKVVVRLGDG